jgi:hypothetical protein
LRENYKIAWKIRIGTGGNDSKSKGRSRFNICCDLTRSN